MLLIKTKSKKFWSPGVVMPIGGASPIVGASYVASVTGPVTGSSSTLTQTFSMDTGTAAANRTIILAIAFQTGSTVAPVTVTVNGTTLAQQVLQTVAGSAGIWSGLVTTGSGTSGGSNVVITQSAGTFQSRDAMMWIATGLSSSNAQAANGNAGTVTISITSGQALFSAKALSTGGNWNGSTPQLPTHPIAGTNAAFADWATNSTGTYTCAYSAGGTNSHVAGSFA